MRRRVAEFFGREPETGIDPDQAVALGAALQAMAMKDVAARPPVRSMGPPPPVGGPLQWDVRWVPSGPPAVRYESPQTQPPRPRRFRAPFRAITFVVAVLTAVGVAGGLWLLGLRP